MDNNIFRKILICGILILFLLTSVAASISGFNGKTAIKITNGSLTNFLLNDDYVNAYWKFDECSGNTAHDSSGHGYDGTIYGAKWISMGSGCALDFDGLNDYIDFSDYAKYYLGFNKTDDLIFSFYFKSSSAEKGVIYSSCRGDAYGYNPGFHIALNPNGRIEVQVWRLNCGIIMNSTGTYNDNTLHFAEILYNGITANPIVEIYIDNQLDSSIKHWVCDFYSDQFKYAEIGRNSHELIDYYDGTLDDFKITKYPGGNEQEPPIIDGPAYGHPDIEYDYSFVTDDPEEDNISLYINWSDGNIEEWIGPYQSGEEVIVSHKWDEEGSYNITARSKDRWHYSSLSDPYDVIIGNQPPGAPTINGPKSGDTGEELTYTFLAEDLEGDDVQYFIDWGDSNSEWTDYHTSSEEVTVTHSWYTEDYYEIMAYAKDELGAEGPWSESYLIRIGNQPPNTTYIDGPSSGKPHVEYKFTFVTTDPEEDNVFYEIKWGDGTEEETDYNTSGETVTVYHVWSKRGTYTIIARACDEFDACGNWSELSFTVPRNKVFDLNYLDWLFQKFPKTFPVIKQLLLGK